jgi:hypothetical protein
MEMRFGTWNMRGLYMASSLITVARELAKNALDLTGVKDVRTNISGTEPTGNFTFSVEMGKRMIN